MKHALWKIGRRMYRFMSRAFAVLLIVTLLLGGLYVANGYLLDQSAPVIIRMDSLAVKHEPPDEIRVLTLNVHQCGAVRKGGIAGVTFGEPDKIEEKIRRIAALLREKDADIVVLNEICIECGLTGVNQVEMMAREAGYPVAVFGHNSNHGLPFFRYREGNAILSKYPIVSTENIDLHESYSPLGIAINRRALKVVIDVAGEKVAVFGVHLDAYNADKNLEQAEELRGQIEKCGNMVMIAGDFNSTLYSAAMKKVISMEIIRAPKDSMPTYVEYPPEKAIDFILSPSCWSTVSYEVVESNLSDHYPVFAVFRLPQMRKVNSGLGLFHK